MQTESDGFGEGDDEKRTFTLHKRRDFFELFEKAEEVGRLHDDGGDLIGKLALEIVQIETAGFGVGEFFDRNALVLGGGFEDFAIFGMNGAGDENFVALGDAHGHHGGFGNGGRAVVHGGVGDVHAGELADHGLKFEDAGESALRNFGLVGRVRSEEFAARDDGIDDDGAEMIIDAGAEEAGIAVGIAGGLLLEVVDDFEFADAIFEVEAFAKRTSAGRCAMRSSSELQADGGEHFAAFRVGLG